MTRTNEPGSDAVTTEWSALVDRVAPLDVDAAREMTDAVTAFTAPVRVQTAGRSGVGRTTVTAALRGTAPTLAADLVETSAVDVPGADDPRLDAEIVVYVLVDSVRTADRRALETAAGSVVVVLNKADTIGTDRNVVDARVADCARECGTTVHPLVATTTSGIGSITSAVNEAIVRARDARGGVLVRAVRRQAAHSVAARDLIEQCLASDAAVALEAAAARVELPELLAHEPGEVRTADDALRNAQWWKSRITQEQSARHRRGVLSIHRDYVRQWARLTGAAPPRET